MARLNEQLEAKYEILGTLREGGMGAVYMVRHRLLEEIRVVKVPEECVREITVEGVFETVTARDWEAPARTARLRSRTLRVGDPG